MGKKQRIGGVPAGTPPIPIEISANQTYLIAGISSAGLAENST